MAKITKIDGNAFRQMMAAASSYLAENKEYVDSLNVFPVPDGDTGTNMSLTFQSAVAELAKVGSNNVGDLAQALARGALMGARGNSGVILSQLLRGFAQEADGLEVLDGQALAKSFSGASKMAYRAVMKPVEGTILTVAREAGEASLRAAREKNDAYYVLKRFVASAKVSLDKTPQHLPVLREAGVVDAGGAGYLVIWEGALKYFDGELITTIDTKTKVEDQVFAGVLSSEEIEFRYCTEFIVQGKNIPQNEMKEYYSTIGDSLIVVGDGDLVKVHVHTNNPGLALEKAVQYGELFKIKIENMVEQNIEAVKSGKAQWDTEDGAVAFQSAKRAEVEKEFGVVAVAAGEGLTEILKSLGVDQVVSGGQTMNPSTADLLEAVENCHAKSVIILPNNKNIITTAKQVPDVTDKQIFVIESRTVPQGIKALLSFNPDSTAQENYANMAQSIKEVKTGEVTFAVRDTKMNGIEIGQEDIIGLAEGKIQAVGKDINSVVKELVSKIVDENSAILTLYFGEDIQESEAEALRAELEEEYPDLEVETYEGNQPLYYYLISVE